MKLTSGSEEIIIPSKLHLIYHRTLPDSFRQVVPKYVNACLFLVPSWLRQLSIGYTPNADEGADHSVPAYNLTQDDYLYSFITLSDNWLTGDDWERTFEMMHEFLHLSSTPHYQYARRTVEKLLDGPEGADRGPRGELIRIELVRKYEAYTQEMTHLLMNANWPTIVTNFQLEFDR